MSSDDEDLLCYTPLQRSQVSFTQKRPRGDFKPSKLSLSRSITQSQTTSNNIKVEKKTVNRTPKRTSLSRPQPGTSNEVDTKPVIKTSPSKSRRRNSRNNTPVKSRADRPDENSTPAELARWRFLYGSKDDDFEQNPQLHAVREPEEGAQEAHDTLPSSQKRKSDAHEDMSGSKKFNGGVCPHCKFPCSSLDLKARHLNICEHKDLSQLSRCSLGSRCSAAYESHYWTYGHGDQPSNNTFGESSSVANKTGAMNNVVGLMDSDSSSTKDSGFNGAPALFSHQKSPPPSPDYLSPSDSEGGESMALFDLKSIKHEFAAHATNDLRRDSVDHTRRDSLDHRSRDSIDNTRRNSVDHTSRDLLDNTRRETIDQARRDSVDHTSRDSIDRSRRDSTDHTRRETIDPTRKDSNASQGTPESRTLLDTLVPNIELIEDDQLTVVFNQDKESDKSSIFSKEEVEEENQPPSPVTCPQETERVDSRTPDLEDIRVVRDQEGDLDDSEGDELIGSVVEEAITNHVIPTMEKVMKWREETKKAGLKATPPTQESSPSPRPRRPHKKRSSPPPCIHIHFHEAGPTQAPTTSNGKERGQTSILQFFKSAKSSGESGCTCAAKKPVAKEGAAAWKGLMGRMQKRELVPLPSVSDSSQDLRSEATSKSWRQRSEKNTCPFYKYIPDASFVVDAFSYGTIDGVKGYFLSHYHYDHYVGLRKNFAQPIYCSEITAKLVSKKIGVAQRYLNPLPMWETRQVHGVGVTLLEANHCPGSVMFLFSVKPGVTHLHVGDFRAHPSMESYTALQNCPIHTLFLDTTYCSPEYDFPPQEKILEKCVSIAQKHQQENNKTLFVVGSYTIGKERVFKAIAESLNCSIWVKSDKKMILNCIDDQEILSRLANDKKKARVHVLPMNNIKGQFLGDYLNQMKPFFTEIVGLCPTGWENTRGSSGGGLDQITPRNPFTDVYIYGIPYSEHSSFSELRRFVQFIKPRKILPTVNNGNQAARKKMEKFFSEWLAGRQLFGQH